MTGWVRRSIQHLIEHPVDIAWAAFFGFIFWFVPDLFSPDSRVKALIRAIRNKRAEKSAARLRERIKELAAARDTYRSFLSSGRAQYLATLNLVMGVLCCIAIAGALSTIGRRVWGFPLDYVAVLFYAIAIVIAIQGVKFATLDTREKIINTVAKYDADLEDLEKKLAAITTKDRIRGNRNEPDSDSQA
jgi:hypothetical protein